MGVIILSELERAASSASVDEKNDEPKVLVLEKDDTTDEPTVDQPTEVKDEPTEEVKDTEKVVEEKPAKAAKGGKKTKTNTKK